MKLNRAFLNLQSRDEGVLRKDEIKIKVNGLINKTIVLIIKLYQSSMRPFMGGQCRFVPSCSEYAIEAVRQFGIIRGLYMAAKRVLRCHPLGPKGFNPPDAG
jgi:putative membrane protein insertion efficiency factor